MFFVLRAAFWVGAVSVLLAATGIPAPETARQSAEDVVGSMRSAESFCYENEELCAAVRGTGSFLWRAGKGVYEAAAIGYAGHIANKEGVGAR